MKLSLSSGTLAAAGVPLLEGVDPAFALRGSFLSLAATDVANLVLQDLMRLVLGGRDFAVGAVSFGPLLLWWTLGFVHPLLAGLVP